MKETTEKRPSAAGRRPNVRGAFGPNGQIGNKLQALYAAAESEPIPDMFLDLLEKLDAAERKEKSGS